MRYFGVLAFLKDKKKPVIKTGFKYGIRFFYVTLKNMVATIDATANAAATNANNENAVNATSKMNLKIPILMHHFKGFKTRDFVKYTLHLNRSSWHIMQRCAL